MRGNGRMEDCPREAWVRHNKLMLYAEQLLEMCKIAIPCLPEEIAEEIQAVVNRVEGEEE